MSLYGLHPRNTTGVWNTLHDRPGVSMSDRGKLGPSGEQRPAELIVASGCAGGCFEDVARVASGHSAKCSRGDRL
jgi:hypothetical protein